MVDFLIIGTPKAGTTAIQSYLNQCKGVFMPAKKELHFFGEEFRSNQAKKNIYYDDLKINDYHKLFRNSNESDLKGEASVFYLYSLSACKQIKEYNPNMKIIACFRNPVDFLISYHQDSLYVENESEKDFWKALKLEEKRKNGECVPETNTLRMALYYKEMISYSKHLKNYINEFGKENIHIVIFEDFFSAPKTSFKKLLIFLNVNVDASLDMLFEKINPRRNTKSEKINAFIRRPKRSLRLLSRIVLPSQKLRLTLYNFIRKLNSSHGKINDLSLSDKHKLTHMFESQITEFEQLLQKDLSFWKKYKKQFP